MYGKDIVYYSPFQASTGRLGTYPPQIRGWGDRSSGVLQIFTEYQ